MAAEARSKDSAAGNQTAGPQQTSEAAPKAGARKTGKRQKRNPNAVQVPDSPDEHDADDAAAAADSDAAEAQELSLDTIAGKKSTAGDLEKPRPVDATCFMLSHVHGMHPDVC